MKHNLETLKNVGKKSIVSAITSLVLSVPSLGMEMEYDCQFVDPFAAFNKPLFFVPTDRDVEGEYEALCKEEDFSGSASFQSDNEWLLQLEAEFELELKNEKRENKSLTNKSVISNKQIIKYEGNYFIDKLSTLSDNVYYWLNYLFYGK